MVLYDVMYIYAFLNEYPALEKFEQVHLFDIGCKNLNGCVCGGYRYTKKKTAIRKKHGTANGVSGGYFKCQL